MITRKVLTGKPEVPLTIIGAGVKITINLKKCWLFRDIVMLAVFAA